MGEGQLWPDKNHSSSLPRATPSFLRLKARSNLAVVRAISSSSPYVGLTEGEGSAAGDFTSSMLSIGPEDAKDRTSWSSRSLEPVTEEWERTMSLFLGQLDLWSPWLKSLLCTLEKRAKRKWSFFIVNLSQWAHPAPSSAKHTWSTPLPMHRLCLSSGVRKRGQGETHYLKHLLLDSILFTFTTRYKNKRLLKTKKADDVYYRHPLVLTGASLLTSMSVVSKWNWHVWYTCFRHRSCWWCSP